MTTQQRAAARTAGRSSPPETVVAPRHLAALAWAGIAGPVLFTLVFLGQDLLREGVEPVAEPVSALSARSGGWIQQLNFVVFGVLTMAHAVGLHLGMRPSRRGWLGPAVLFVAGVAAVMAAAFPVAEAVDGELDVPVGHMAAGTVFFLGTPVALLLLSRRMRHDERWRTVATPVLVLAVAVLVVAVGMRALVVSEDAPLFDYFGLAQRLLVIGLLFPARILVAQRLLTVARAAE